MSSWVCRGFLRHVMSTWWVGSGPAKHKLIPHQSFTDLIHQTRNTRYCCLYLQLPRSENLSNTTCCFVSTVKTPSLGWGIPCSTYPLLWTKTSLTSRTKGLICFRRLFAECVLKHAETFFLMPSSLKVRTEAE